jgi:hypothetical protein
MLNNHLKKFGGINDNYIIGTTEEIFHAYDEFSMDLMKVGLEFQPRKSACYIAEQICIVEWDALWSDIPNGSITDRDENKVFQGQSVTFRLAWQHL